VWSKLRGYLARLSLILAVCRSVQSTTSEERVEREDVAAAAKLLVYFKVHARRVFAEIGSPDPLEALGSALKALIEDQGGKLEATATEIYHALQEVGCEVLPGAPRETEGVEPGCQCPRHPLPSLTRFLRTPWQAESPALETTQKQRR
jgi:hypothetical protein